MPDQCLIADALYIVVAASTASNVSSVAFAACCSEVGAGGETGSGEDGSGDCVMDTSDSGAGGSAHIRGTGNSGYSGGVSGASVAPAAAVDHFNPSTDLAPVIAVVAASTASNPLHLPPLPEQMTTAAVGVMLKSLLTCCLRRSSKGGRRNRTIAWMKERRRTSYLKWK